ncbi:tape measure protein [Mesorhizobium silamurunense]|uniref:tape measure protein n=1 Tax=Mesorhizobium silamurunense TaxID=499528 RepID=UPI00178268A9|nr:tape measure protein [Mesorhizobium silamurunense]
MAESIGSIYASLTMETGGYAAGWALADRITARGASSIRKEAGLAQASIERFTRSTGSGIRPYGLIAVSRAFERVNDRVGLLRGTMLATTAVFGGLTAALSSNLVLRYADTYNNLSNQIRVVSDDASDLAGQLAGVAAAANNSRASLSATAVLYSRLAKAAPSTSSSTILQYVETIQKALTLGGATAQEATSAAIQFSQAIASNRLGGDEFRAVLETPLGMELAKGLDVTIGKLRQMSIAGQLTADKVLGALEKIKGSIDEDFNKSVLTIDQSLVKADNQLTQYVGTLDKTYGLTRIVSGGILVFANNIDTVANSASALGLALGAAFAGRLVGRGAGKAVDATFGEISRRAADAKEEVQKLTKVQHDLAEQLDRGTRAFGNLQGRDNLEFASKSDLKILQREEAKLNRIRESRLATTTKLRDAIDAANTVEVKSTKQSQAAADRIVETQGKIEASQTRQISLANELAKAETRLTAAKGQQAINVSNIGAVKEAERDITRIRQQQVSEATKQGALEEQLGNQRINLANRIGVAEAQAAEQRSKYQKIAADQTKESVRLHLEEYDQTQRLGRARAAIDQVGAIGKGAEMRAAQAELDGLRTSLETTSTSLSVAVKNTSVLRQSFGLLKSAGAGLVGFLGGPWGVAFTGAISLLTIMGIKSAEAAQEQENTKKALHDVLGSIADAGGKTGQAAETSLKTEEIKGELTATEDNIKLFQKSVDKQSTKIEQSLTRAFDPFVNPKLIGQTTNFPELFAGATAGVKSLVDQVARGELAFADINKAIRALPEAKFIDADQVDDLAAAVAEEGKLQLAIDKTTARADQLNKTLKSGVGNLNVEDEINKAAAASANALEIYETNLKQSQKTAQGLLFNIKQINDESDLESKIRQGTAAVMKDNKDLLEGEARDVAIVNTVLDTINGKSEEWLRSTEATSGFFAQILARAKQIAPNINFDKPEATATQLAAIDDLVRGQVEANKRQLERRGLYGDEQQRLEIQDDLLAKIAGQNIKVTDAVRQRVKVGSEAIAGSTRELQILDAVSNALEHASSQDLSQSRFAGVANAFDAITQRQIDMEAVSTQLKLAQTDLAAAFSVGRDRMFGQSLEIDGLNQQYGAIEGRLQALINKFLAGRLPADKLATGIANIREELKKLGANSDALDGFIKGIEDALLWIAKLTGAINTFKQNPIVQRAGATGTRTTYPDAGGVSVTRFSSGSGGSSDTTAPVVTAVENGVNVTRYGQDQTTAATKDVGTSVDTVDQSVRGGFSNLTGAVNANTNMLALGMSALGGAVMGSATGNSGSQYGAQSDAIFNAFLDSMGVPESYRMGSPSSPSNMFGPNWDPQHGSHVGDVINLGPKPHIKLGPTTDGTQVGITVGDINVNGVSDGAEAGRQAAYEFVRTVYGAMSSSVA